MKLTFYGAAETVTGSCHMLSVGNTNVLIDCGMYQGSSTLRTFNNEEFKFPINKVTAMVLTHAHIDHSGLIPKLVKDGYSQTIYATEAARDLCEIMLEDSAHIQETDAEYDTRKNKRKGLPAVEPLYTSADAEASMKLFSAVNYGETVKINEDVSFRIVDAGHMLGSGIVEFFVTENGKTEKVVFSGDLGNMEKPLLNDPTYLTEADYLVMESTYGGRNHTPVDALEKFKSIIIDTISRGGTLVIPAFAVGRTQDILYELNYLIENRLLGEFSDVRVVVDSPLAVKATEVFKRHYEILDEATQQLISSGDDPLVFKNLEMSVSTEESKALNADNSPKIIISASGMCDAGRIRHHIKHNVYKPNCTILFVGYQSQGSLGRLLLDGERDIKLFGERIAVAAKIESIDYFSGHADHNTLVKWAETFDKQKLKRIFLVHGEQSGLSALADAFKADGYDNVSIAKYLGSFDSENVNLAEFDALADESKQISFPFADTDTAIDSLAVMAEKIAERLKDKEKLLKENSFDKIKLFLESVNDIIDRD